MTCVALGAMFAGHIPTRFRRDRVESRGHIGGDDYHFLIMGVAGFAWGAASDRFGPRIVVLLGALLLGLGLFVARAVPPRRSPFKSGSASSWVSPRELVLRSDDRDGDRVVQHPTSPRGVSRFGRHGRRADDDLAPRGVAHLELRLAHGDGRDRRTRLGVAYSGGPARSCTARRGRPASGGRRSGRSCRKRAVPHIGSANAAVHRAGGDALPLLCGPFRSHLSHGELRDFLRHSDDRRR